MPAWLIAPSEMNPDIDCVLYLCLSGCSGQTECVSVIETEPVGSVIYSLFRSSFPRVHSSLPSTRRRRARPFHASPSRSNLSSLRKGKGWLCLSRHVQRHPAIINSLWCAFFFLELWFIVRIVLFIFFNFLLTLHALGRKRTLSLWFVLQIKA